MVNAGFRPLKSMLGHDSLGMATTCMAMNPWAVVTEVAKLAEVEVRWGHPHTSNQ